MSTEEDDTPTSQPDDGVARSSSPPSEAVVAPPTRPTEQVDESAASDMASEAVNQSVEPGTDKEPLVVEADQGQGSADVDADGDHESPAVEAGSDEDPPAVEVGSDDDRAVESPVHTEEPSTPVTRDDAASEVHDEHGSAVAAEAHEPEIENTEVPEEPEAVEETGEQPAARPGRSLPRVIAVANQKGGVGKTTTTVNVAACLAEQGYRTLLVDLDPQANASTGLGLEPRELEHSIYHVMLHDEDADSCIEPTEVKNLFVLPSSLDLAGAEIELVPAMSREHRLRLAIEAIIEDYDYVLIDCPPSLGLLTINAFAAATEVLVPIQCEYYALEGLGQLMRNIDLVRANLNPALEISHIVLVMFDPRTKLAGQVVDEVREHFGDTVCENVIPRTVRLSEAPSYGQPITTFDSDSRGAAAYRDVTQEVIDGQA